MGFTHVCSILQTLFIFTDWHCTENAILYSYEKVIPYCSGNWILKLDPEIGSFWYPLRSQAVMLLPNSMGIVLFDKFTHLFSDQRKVHKLEAFSLKRKNEFA